MKIRTKKVLSLLLAASMVLGMNTMAFGDEIAEVADTATVAEDTGASVAASDASDNGDGFLRNADGGLATTVTFAAGTKKNAKTNIATITNVTNPVSWNNFYGRNLIATVLFGDTSSDEYLNNKDKLPVSSNVPLSAEEAKTNTEELAIDGIVDGDNDYSYSVYPVNESEKVYLLVGYSLDSLAYVNGYDSYAGADLAPLKTYTTEDRIAKLPVSTWDGRKIVLDKNGKYSATKSQKEVLDVSIALVQYAGTTVTELDGASVASVKLDKKAMKEASVEYATTDVKVSGSKKVGTEVKTEELTIPEHKTLGTIPSFTINAKLGKEVKKYKKEVKAALKDKKFEFGILQRGITVEDPTDDVIYNYVIDNLVEVEKDKTETASIASSYKIKDASANDATKMTELVAKAFEKGGYRTTNNKEAVALGDSGLKISKFNEKKATVEYEVGLWKDGKWTKDDAIALKKGKDFELKEGTLAGEKVFYLDLIGKNYVYANTAPYEYKVKDEKTGKEETKISTNDDLSAFGYKWAFRKSPTDKKAFRVGIFADTDRGFVFGK